MAIWLFGTSWAQRQAKEGRCSLAVWLGADVSVDVSAITLDTTATPVEDPDQLVEVIRFNPDPEERRRALTGLAQLGMVEPLNQDPTEWLSSDQGVVQEEAIPSKKKDRSYVWFIVLAIVLIGFVGLNAVDKSLETRTARATAQARATSTQSAVLAVTATWVAIKEIPRDPSLYPVVFFDGFEIDKGNWRVEEEVEGSRTIEGGIYHWEGLGERSHYWWDHLALENPPIEFVLSVDGSMQPGPLLSAYGVTFRSIDDDSFYAFLVSNSRYYRVIYFSGGERTLIEQSAHSSIIRGGTNKLTVISDGAGFFLFVNNQLVYTFTDTRFGFGDAGLITLVGSGDEAIIQFDNFELRELPLSPESVDASDLVLAGENRARVGDIEVAMRLYEKAQSLDSNAELSANSWNTLCWYGCLWGYASRVMDACETAVALDPDHGGIRDSRGLARALNDDYAGAIEDFEYFVEWAQERYDEKVILRRQNWIRDLEAGINPFTPEVLEVLKDE
jgi:hypothetical protein